ncbi:putative mediator of RNA polymerase II transcription subunit 26 isoform X11 [Drosophila rhopaloa]|uniref:Mediator of RNA polymerase II transcription subunit 26 isoform X11 n=1 Tax=Drosophila rhopaloa TaxID=1041015 RepID=A0A6P4EHS1_DRORH|nr:putative mediator of RNA polymerase II transcription subunit 26 isoform X11 [Drosophila rhopaloa]
MEVECDLGDIQNEELLRKMWQQSEDSERKKQIRSHLYKLRESRLCNLYRHESDPMSEPNGNGHGNVNTLAGYAGKDPLATSHGDALLDQNFQSLKSKEVRDSTSPTHELRFHSMTLSQPNTTGWDVQTSSEVSPDGRAYRTETLAKTDGVEKLNGGGLAEFKGRNEQRSSASHQGDDKNFVKQASDSSKTQLQETVVFGDENSGRTEMKMSSTSTSSTSKVVSSSSTVEYGDEPRYLLDSQEKKPQQSQQQQHHQREWEQEQRRQEQRIQEQMQRQEQQIRQEQLQRQEEFQRQEQIQRQEQLQRQEERFSESREQSNSTRNVQTQQHYEENKRYVDMDKASPEYQRHVQHLMEQPGEIISNTVEYPKPNVKMITTVKRLPDGTIVKNKRYETEQLTPSQNQNQTTHKQTNNQSHNQTRNQTHNQTHNQRRAQDVQDSQVRDVVDNVEQKHVTESQSFSSVKKSSRRFSTETTSETVEEYDDRGQPLSKVVQKAPAPTTLHSQPRQSPTSDFSTHGFPSVRPNKPTQEYPSQRPAAAGEEVVVVRSEKSRQVKQQTSSQRTTETEVVGDDYNQPQRSPQKLREAPSPSWEQPSPTRRQPVDEDFSTHGFPSVRTTTTRSDQPDGEVLQTAKTVSRNQSANRKTNTERIIETQVEHPHAPSHTTHTHTHSTPRSGSPRRSQPREDYGNQGVTSPRGPAGKPSQTRPSTTGGSSTTKTTTTSEPLTRRQLQKEREVDAAHRAFAASLRSSSPADSTTSVGSHHQTPRSSVSSNRTFRREMREGSHDSQAPSESSRISSTTVTRHTGGHTTSSTTKTKTTRPVKSPSEPRSPTPKAGGNVITTTTTTTSSTTKSSPSPAPPSPTSAPASSAPPDNKLSQYTYTTTKPGDIFSLPPTTPPTINNEPTLTTTTKTTTTTSNNQNHPKQSAIETATATDTDSQPIRKVKLSANEAMVVEEAPCVRRQYYQLGNEGENPETPESSGTPEKSITTTYTTNTTGRNVGSRRNVFEVAPAQETPVESEPTGRRPSYMDHTKSSLEHIRRDSLEINKSHYSRKSSVEDDSPVEPRNPNTSVKFDVPRKTPSRGGDEPRKGSLKGKDDDSDLELEIEEIFDLQRLEKLLETVASYEMRRRIRAQMRLIRKNMINAGTTTTITTITTTTTPGKSSPLPKKREQSPVGSPETKSIGSSLKEVRTTTSRRRVEQVDSTTAPGKTSPQGKPPVKPRERSASPAQKRRNSPPGKQSPGDRSTTLTTKVTTSSTTRGAPSKPAQGPIWADRSKVLKGHATVPQQTNGSTPRKGSTSSTTSSSGKITRTLTSSSTTTSSSSTTNSRNKQGEEDSITSSYGVGPTDENGLPLFGIRALKKKATPPIEEPCETKQEVTGYVIEEQFYSDNKSPPRHERKELIYSSNADELAAIKQQLQDEDDSSPPELDARVVREFKKVESQQSLPEDARYVRRGSVKELSEKFIRKESSSSTHSTQSSTAQSLVRHGDETEEDSESNEVCSVIEAPQMRQNQSHISSTTRSSNTRSFLNSSADQRQVTSVDDVLERMRNADNVEEAGDTSEDREARALLNKFLGASVIMQGVESMLPPTATGQRLNSQGVKTTRITNTYSKSGNSTTNKVSSSSAPVTRTTCDIEEIWDEQILKQLLEQASTYEERRKIRARLRELMAEREAAQHKSSSTSEQRTETKSKDGGATMTTTTTKVTTRTVSGSAASKNISPLAKFKQLDKQAAAQQAQKSSPTTSTPTTPGGSAQPLFKFTDPALNARAATVKDQLLQWCQHKTQEYENVQISNFSSSWSDGLAFCALIHHFLPDAFDYNTLTKQTRRHNFELAFSVADEKAGIAPLLDVEDMVEMSRPDWKCVFVYVQSIYRRFRNCQ